MPALPTRFTPVETVRYVARPGLLALPSGTGMAVLFLFMQGSALTILLWAIWWPHPRTPSGWAFALISSGVLVGSALAILWTLIRRSNGMARGILMAPFIRLTVTDRRVIWTLPWSAEPLMEIGLSRVHGGILGDTDRFGRGNAAILLHPDDPAGEDGYIHLDRLPQAHRFVAALGQA
ncbi:hypothetical protein [Sphingomonas jatrophae]|uniref:PH domain-containing protein n=1 Tax=Sphingomonas jatrophae TaxID=1166337 RepID=A0A1I6M6P7_9SPHN|nr:hypothetical protein [Sphingomonas jatrophae]SFS11172.1 hypothetical protein SAMN05192580_3537 [Sphingomonas jatrophae]